MIKAIILAGGAGTRLYPVTKEIPKPLLTIHGRPVVAYLLEQFIRAGILPVMVVNFEQRTKFAAVFPDHHFVYESRPQGTLKAIVSALSLVEGDSYFFVSNGDELKDFNPQAMLAVLKQRKDLVGVLAITRVKDTMGYGTVKIDRRQRIIQFAEKSDCPLSNWISAGLYVFRTASLIATISQLGINAFNIKSALMIEKDLFPRLASLKKIGIYRLKGQFLTIDNLERYGQAIESYRPYMTNGRSRLV